ncbi:hypothetical protein NDU88_006777 [Pleurodeles waltl]|uniref:Uncharacterized protein n=1 Tax=Pleurodeles waltl TaxID=8319 RepID=A0AAV7SQM9_PLEWA|nr:hypothetical protein NDU88_006777 [Pleurodeles waltl]
MGSVCARAACAYMGLGMLRLRRGQGCLQMAAFSGPGRSPETMWVYLCVQDARVRGKDYFARTILSVHSADVHHSLCAFVWGQSCVRVHVGSHGACSRVRGGGAHPRAAQRAGHFWGQGDRSTRSRGLSS